MRQANGRFEATVWVRRRLRFERLLDELATNQARRDEGERRGRA